MSFVSITALDNTHANQLSDALLLLANSGNTSYPPESNVYDFGTNSSIRLLVRNYFPLVHPMHLHGHNFWVLAEGTGDWDGTVNNKLNPQRRDTHLLVPGSTDVPSYVVFEFEADNPGVWPLHCHLIIHISIGLYINILVGSYLLPSFFPAQMIWADANFTWVRSSRNVLISSLSDRSLRPLRRLVPVGLNSVARMW